MNFDVFFMSEKKVRVFYERSYWVNIRLFAEIKIVHDQQADEKS